MGALMATGDNIERILMESRANRGYTVSEPWFARDAFAYNPTAEAVVSNFSGPTTDVFGFGRIKAGSLVTGGVWNGAAGDATITDGATMIVPFQCTDQFSEYFPHLSAIINAGKYGAGTDNTTLALTVEAWAIKPNGGSVVQLCTSSLLLGAKVTAGAGAELDQYKFDIGKGARDAGTDGHLKMGTQVLMKIAPSAAIGTNLNLVITGGEFQYNSYASLGRGKTRGTNRG